MRTLLLTTSLCWFAAPTVVHSAPQANDSDPWVVYEGTRGPGKGRHIVFISGDEEYRSEEGLPQLARIAAVHHGFKCTVLFPINKKTGDIDPETSDNIPGTTALANADLMVIATRFRDLPDEQMQPIDDYLRRGGPVVGMRTATHAFNVRKHPAWKHYSNGYKGEKQEWTDGFGRLVLGEKWISHHGGHKNQSTRGMIADGAASHPITRGLKNGDVWGDTDVYGVRLPLPGDSQPLILGQVMNRKGPRDNKDVHFGMRPDDDEPAPGPKNNPMMPVAWTKSYTLPGGTKGRAFTTTMGSASDLLSEGTRRMLLNGIYWSVGLEDAIPSTGTAVDLVGQFKPSQYGFGTFQKGLRVDIYRVEVSGDTGR